MAEQKEKVKALEDAFKQIEKQFGKRFCNETRG